MKARIVSLGHFTIAILHEKVGTSGRRGKALIRESELPSSFLPYHRQRAPFPQQGPTGNKETRGKLSAMFCEETWRMLMVKNKRKSKKAAS